MNANPKQSEYGTSYQWKAMKTISSGNGRFDRLIDLFSRFK
jgi:hypothetical protein